MKEQRKKSLWMINHGVSQRTKTAPGIPKKRSKMFFSLSPPTPRSLSVLFSLPEGHLAVLFESDGSQRETKVRLEAWIYHDRGFWTGWPAATKPAPAGPELQAAADQSLQQVLQPLHGGLQQQHRLWRRLQGRPGVLRALPGPAVLLQVYDE